MKKVLVLFVVFTLFSFLMPTSVRADHSWGSFHWEWDSSWTIPLRLGNNVSGQWQNYFTAALGDWSEDVFGLVDYPGEGGRNCRPTEGRVEVCNAKYGFNGWLGIAQIWTRGDHIYQGVTKVNDSYFRYQPYNSDAWKQMVMCQELGHNFGLGHTDEAFENANHGTCMDYTDNPLGPPSNLQPNFHDYEMLRTIYGHTDASSTVDTSTPPTDGDSGGNNGKGNGKGKNKQGLQVDLDDPASWGRLVRDNGRIALFERDFGSGHKLLTRVIWSQAFNGFRR